MGMSKVPLILFLLCSLSFAAPLRAISGDIENPGSGNILGQSAFGDLDAIAGRRILRILVTHSQTDFFFDKGQIRGMQVEIARGFLARLNAGRTNRFHASEAYRIFPAGYFHRPFLGVFWSFFSKFLRFHIGVLYGLEICTAIFQVF